MTPMKNRDKFYKLAVELKATDPIKYKAVIKNLVGLEYDDFSNETFATPKLQMIADFTQLGRQDIVDRVKEGEFDQ